MNGHGFQRITSEAFSPFLKSLGFVMGDPLISGRYYRVNFNSLSNCISVSYEPGDESVFVIVFSRKNGVLSDVDDSIHTPRLSDLNRIYMPLVTDEERVEVELFFRHFEAMDKGERMLLKAARDLRLVLPKYLGAH